jgi:hypothetical protein
MTKEVSREEREGSYKLIESKRGETEKVLRQCERWGG